MSRCHRRRHAWRRPRPSLSSRRLYRDPARGRIAGVCAGLAQYFGISRTMMRFIAVTALIFVPQVTGIAYLLAILIVPTREELELGDAWAPPPETDPDLAAERARARSFDQRLDETRQDDLDGQRRAARQARDRLGRIDERMRRLEAYVTSRRFGLDQEFGKL
jgi:phage shock protein C